MFKWCHNAMVEAVEPLKLHPAYISYTNLRCLRIVSCGGWAYGCNLRPFPSSQLFLGLGNLAERVGDDVSAKMINDTTSLWLRLQKPFKLHPTSIWYIFNVYEHSFIWWMGIWMHWYMEHHHHKCSSRFGRSLGWNLGDVSAQMIPLRYGWGCRTFQTASHIHLIQI